MNSESLMVRPSKQRLVEVLGLSVFVLYFTVYVISNASTTFEASESPAKHLVMVAVAYLSLLLLPIHAFRSLLIFAPLAIIYLLGSLPAYALDRKSVV